MSELSYFLLTTFPSDEKLTGNLPLGMSEFTNLGRCGGADEDFLWRACFDSSICYWCLLSMKDGILTSVRT